jgi:hypothetical protein
VFALQRANTQKLSILRLAFKNQVDAIALFQSAIPVENRLELVYTNVSVVVIVVEVFIFPQ